MPAVAALLVGVGILMVFVARASAARRRVRDLRQAIDLYALDSPDVEDAPQTSALLARSGLIAERAMGERWIARVKRVLERSDWALSPGELVVVSLAAGVIAGAFGALVQGVLLGVGLAAVGLVVPYAAVVRSVARRRRAFDEQFPDLLDLLAGSLEAGASVTQALQLVVEESDEPAASEFGRVFAATAIGMPLTEALATAAQRLGSSDLDWTVQAISVQHRTGGRLADILRIVAATMRDRAEVQRELRALTAEGRLSGYVLGGLPFVLAGLLLLLNPRYLQPLLDDPLGWLMLGGAGTLMLAAFAWMRTIVKVVV